MNEYIMPGARQTAYCLLALLIIIIHCPLAIMAGEPEPHPIESAADSDMDDSDKDDIADQSAQIGATRIWQRFVKALSAGRMENAYACYTRPSQKLMPFETFCAQHHPLTRYSEIILRAPEQSSLTVMGQKAILRATPGVSRDDASLPEVKFFMVNECGQWRMVSPMRWRLASMEADARLLLGRIHRLALELISSSGHRLNPAAFKKAHPKLFSSQLYKSVSTIYDIQIHVLNKDEWVVVATPKEPPEGDTGLRQFSINSAGELATGKPGMVKGEKKE